MFPWALAPGYCHLGHCHPEPVEGLLRYVTLSVVTLSIVTLSIVTLSLSKGRRRV